MSASQSSLKAIRERDALEWTGDGSGNTQAQRDRHALLALFDERPFARMLAVAHLRLNAIEPALRTIIEQHGKDGCIAAGAFDAGRDALQEVDESKAREVTRG